MTSPPQSVGPFQICAPLGEGGMGVVYEATRPGDSRRFAVKLARERSDLLHASLEVQAAARLSHPHIVAVEAWGEHDGRLWVAMPRLSGQSLSQRLLRVAPAVRLQLIDQLLDALAYAHDRGVVHRDLKPDNVFVDESQPGKPHAWLMDFGIAALASPMAVGAVHAADELRGGTPGTPSYMAPEQLRGGAVGPEADLYAVGVLLFVAFTGRLPFEGSPLQVLIAKSRCAAPPLCPSPSFPAGLARLIGRLLATHPLDRYPCASAVRAALAPLVDEVAGAMADGVETQSSPLQPVGPRPRATEETTSRDPVARATTSLSVELTPRASTLNTDAVVRLLRRAHDVERTLCAKQAVVVGLPGVARTSLIEQLGGALESSGWAVLGATGGSGGTPWRSLGAACRPRGPFREVIRSWVMEAANPFELERRLPEAPPELLSSLIRTVGAVNQVEIALVPAQVAPRDDGTLLFTLVEHLSRERPVLLVLDAGGPDGNQTHAFVEAALRRLANRAVFLVVAVTSADTSAADERVDLPSAVTSELSLANAEMAEALGLDTVEALRRASLLCPVFCAPLLEAVGATTEGIERLVTLGVLVAHPASPIAGTPGLRFARGAGRQILRDEFEPDQARTVHAAAAAWLDARSELLQAEGLVDLALHWEAVGRPDRAAAWQYRAGRRAEADGAMSLAMGIYRSLLASIDSRPEDHEAPVPVDLAGLLLAAARVAYEQGELADATLWAVRALADEFSSRVLVRADARRLLAEIHRAAGENAIALDHLGQGLDAVGPSGDRIMRALLLGRRGWLKGYVMGHNGEGRDDVEAAFALLDGLDVPAVEAQLWSHLGAIELRACRWDEQLAANERALALSELAGDTPGRIRSHINLGVCHHNRGHLAEAARSTLAASELAALAGTDTRRVIALNNLGLIRLDQGLLDEATEALEDSASLAERCGSRDMLFETLGALARVALRRGHVDSAVVFAARATGEASHLGSPVAMAHAHRVTAMVLSAGGNAGRALSILHQAERLTEHADRYEHAVTRLALAHLCGRETESIARELRAFGADPDTERARWVICPG